MFIFIFSEIVLYMDPKYFNGAVMHVVNELWTGKVLKMRRNLHRGVDLIDDKKVVEVKFRVVGEKAGAEKYPKIWTVEDYQLGYGKNTTAIGQWANII